MKRQRLGPGVFVILTTHSYFLKHDAKQMARMTPYSPLSTLIATALLRDGGHDVTHFDSTFADGIDAFESALERQRPAQYSFSRHVEQKLVDIRKAKARTETSTPT